jgi:hypothetical protein
VEKTITSNTHARWFGIPLLSSLLLVGANCSSRPETPKYFSDSTGIDLCEQAQVSNDGKPKNLGVGFEYRVLITMDEACEKDFFSQVRKKGGAECGPGWSCFAELNDGNDIQIEPLGSLYYRVIYAD